MTASTLVIISYYDRRPVDRLHALLKSMSAHSAGADYDVAVVANRTSDAPLAPTLPAEARLHERDNIGMNIGAWDHGWRAESGYETFLFLQDECFVVRDGWLAAFVDKANAPGAGVVGEIVNPAWDKPWTELRALHAGTRLPDHWIDGAPAERVAVYLDFMERNGIDPGGRGRHVNSIVWCLSRTALATIDGFPIGANYGECIAAEIAVSRNLEAAGLRVEQVDVEPFRYVRHVEWNRSHPSAPFTHAPVQAPAPPDPQRAADLEALAGPNLNVRMRRWLRRVRGRA